MCLITPRPYGGGIVAVGAVTVGTAAVGTVTVEMGEGVGGGVAVVFAVLLLLIGASVVWRWIFG